MLQHVPEEWAGNNRAARRNTQKGFTFLEVLIALTILSVAGLGVVQLVQDAQDTLGRSRQVIRAESYALYQLKELEEDGLSSITDRTGEDEDAGLAWQARAYDTAVSGYYRLSISVWPLGDESDPLVTLEKLFIERF